MVHYHVKAIDLQAHLYEVNLHISQPASTLRVSLPVWIPGSYLVREFSRHVLRIEARQGATKRTLTCVDKATWEVSGLDEHQPLVLTYQVYAFDASVRTAWLDAQRGFFNGTSLCLRVEGRTHEPHELQVMSPDPSWTLATGLQAHKTNAKGFGIYRAADYDELVDCPVEMGPHWRGEFKAGGISHELVVSGAAPSFDGVRLLGDVQRICEAQIRFWHGRGKPPFKRYVFMLRVVDEGYGGLEHRNSTALIAARRDLPQTGHAEMTEGYITLLGLFSHEYFHTWNVKRLKPAEFAAYDYSRENYTQMLWFFEGFTSYYDDLFLWRAGLIDTAQYLKLLARTWHLLQQTPGRHVQSVAQSSFDAWVKYYRSDENTPNSTVSYYGKGSLIAACLDFTLRGRGQGSLDEVMHLLWQHSKGGAITEADVLMALQQVSGRSFAKEIKAWVHGTKELPFLELIQELGVQVHRLPTTCSQRLGLRVQDLKIKAVLKGSYAQKLGLSAHDEILAVNGWRLKKLEDWDLYASQARQVQVLVARDQQLITLTGPARAPSMLDVGAVQFTYKNLRSAS